MALLLVAEAVVMAVNSGSHGSSGIVAELGGHIEDMVVLFILSGILVRNVETTTEGCGVGDLGGDGTDTSCSKACKERGAIVLLCGGGHL